MAMAIDEVVDDYENEDRVVYKENIFRNATLDCMQLNITQSQYQNFDIYTEVDEDNKLTVDGNVVSFATYERHDRGFVYYDFGVDYFGDFEILYECNLTDLEAGDASNVNTILHIALTNIVGDWQDLTTDDAIGASWKQDGALDDRTRFGFQQYDGGAIEFSVVEGLGNHHPLDTWFIIMNRSGTDCGMFVFTDEARTVLLMSHEQTGVTTEYRYLEIAISIDSDNDPTDHITGYVSNVDLGGVGTTEGYFNTTNFLDGLSYNATVLLTNSLIPSGSINAQISGDGSSWSDLGGLTSGYGAIDLRGLGLVNSFFMFNFSSADPDNPPLLYQVRLVHEGPGTGTTTTTTDETPFIAIGLILAMAMVLLANKARK